MWEDNALLLHLPDNAVKVDFGRLAAEGADAFIINAVYPDSGDNPLENPPYRSQLVDARKTGRLVGASILHDPFTDQLSYDTIHLQTDLFGAVTNGYRPDFAVADVQMGSIANGTRTINITPTNLRMSLSHVLDDFWKRFKLPGILYTRTNFIKEYGGSEVSTMLDNANKNGTQWAFFAAYWKAVGVTVSTLRDCLKNVSLPTVTEENTLLSIGSYAPWQAWECVQVLHPAVLGSDGKMVPFAVMIWHGNRHDMYAFFGRTVPGDTVPNPTPTVPEDLSGVIERLGDMEAKLDLIVSLLKGK